VGPPFASGAFIEVSCQRSVANYTVLFTSFLGIFPSMGDLINRHRLKELINCNCIEINGNSVADDDRLLQSY
jgi:hypothetical protein